MTCQHRVEPNEVRETTRALIAGLAEVPIEQVGDQTDLVAELRIDSLLLIELLVRLEERYRIRIGDEETPRMRTVLAVTDLVTRRLQDQESRSESVALRG